MFFRENNRFEERKACFGDFSIFGKIAISGPYRRGHFLIDFEYFLKCWKYPSNSSQTFKILFFRENNRFEERKACFGDFSIFGKIAISGPYRHGHFFVDFEHFLKGNENTLPILPKHSKFCSFVKTIGLKKEKNVLGTFQFLAKSLNPDLTSVAIFWLTLSIFWNVENTFQIFQKHSKFCSLMKNNYFEEKKHVLGTFQFSGKSLYPDLTGVAFFGWFWVFFEILKIRFQFFWKHSKCWCLSWKQSVWRKKSMFCGTFQFLDQNRCIRTITGVAISLVDFLYFSKCWKHPSNSSRNIQNFVLSWKQSLGRKKSMFWGLFNFRQNRCIRTLPAWPFFAWFWIFFDMLKIPFQFFRNIQNFVLSWKQSVWRKKSMFWGLFNISAKSLYPHHTGVAIFWLILNIFWHAEITLPILPKTFKILFFHENNRFEDKKAFFGDFSIFGKIAVSAPLRAWPFFGWFCVFFQMLKIPLQFFWNIQNFVISWKQSVWRKKTMFWGFFNFWQNRCIRTIPAWRFFGWFWVFFEILKIPFQFFRKIQNFVLSWKQSVWRKKSMFRGLFNFWQNRCIRTLPAWPFFAWFWIFFDMLKIPFQFFRNIQNFVLSWKQSLWRKKSMFWGLFNFRENRWIRTLPAWPFFGWFWVFFEMLKIPFQFFRNIQNFGSFMKTITLKKKNACFWILFNFRTKIDVSGPYRHGHFFVEFEYFLKYWKYSSNSSETFKILFFHWNNRFEEKKGCFGDF